MFCIIIIIKLLFFLVCTDYVCRYLHEREYILLKPCFWILQIRRQTLVNILALSLCTSSFSVLALSISPTSLPRQSVPPLTWIWHEWAQQNCRNFTILCLCLSVCLSLCLSLSLSLSFFNIISVTLQLSLSLPPSLVFCFFVFFVCLHLFSTNTESLFTLS